jgi:hypothetical protein
MAQPPRGLLADPKGRGDLPIGELENVFYVLQGGWGEPLLHEVGKVESAGRFAKYLATSKNRRDIPLSHPSLLQ